MDGARMALVIANDEYQDPGLRRLRSPAHDAAALSAVLGDPTIGQFTVEVASNQPSNVVQARIEDFFLEANPDDLLLLHFSCHGVKSESGKLYFAATNTRPSRLGSTAVAAEFVQQCMRTSRSRSVVLFLDCCYGGAFSQGTAVRATGSVDVLGSFPGDQLGSHGRGRAVITASSSMEYAFEGDQLADDHAQRPSVFTHALVHGLRTGDADLDEDGRVSLNELYEYLFDQVRDANPHQTPGRNVELQGEIYLAKSRRRRIHPMPLPADLREAIMDTNLFTRLGAISELRARLVSDNLGVARAAFDALQDMAGHDIQQVAAAARTALADARLTPSESQISLGDLPQGSAVPDYTVRLLGPPLARVAVPQATPTWLQVRQDDDGLHLSVDTSTAGPQAGQLTIEGPTGQATIHVDARIVSPLPEASAAERPAAPHAEPPVVGRSEGATATAPAEETIAAAAHTEEAEALPVPTQTHLFGLPTAVAKVGTDLEGLLRERFHRKRRQDPPRPRHQEPLASDHPVPGEPQPPDSQVPAATPPSQAPGPAGPTDVPAPAPIKPHLRVSVIITVVLGLTSLVAFLPGLVAIAYARAVQRKLRRGDLGAARKESSRAKVWIWLTVATWVAFWITIATSYSG